MDDSCTLREAFFTRAFWMQGMSWFFLALALYAVLIHLVPYAIRVGISSIQASVILGLAGGCSVLGRLVMGSVSDKLGRKNSLVIGGVIKIMALLWLLITTKLWMFYLFSFVFGFSYGAWGALMPAMTADNFGQRNSGAIFGTMFLFPGTGVSIGPLVAGYTIDLTKSYLCMFLITIGASVFGLLFILLIRTTKR
jgi:MFS family permease